MVYDVLLGANDEPINVYSNTIGLSNLLPSFKLLNIDKKVPYTTPLAWDQRGLFSHGTGRSILPGARRS